MSGDRRNFRVTNPESLEFQLQAAPPELRLKATSSEKKGGPNLFGLAFDS